jgi:hypothetical protein
MKRRKRDIMISESKWPPSTRVEQQKKINDTNLMPRIRGESRGTVPKVEIGGRGLAN